MGSFGNQLRQVVRRLVRTPMFSLIVLITLAVSVGANTAIFTVVESVLLKPLPYPHSAELVGVWLKAPGINIPKLSLSPSTYFIDRDQGRTFQDIGLYTGDSVNITGVAEPEQVRGLDVTDGTLPILGIPPMLGRWFNRTDDSPGSPDTVMLTYGYWQRKFGGDPAIVGRTILVDGKGRQVIGVMPARFHFLDMDDPPVILPFQFDRRKTHLGNYSYPGVARLKPGVTLAEASADLARLLPIVNRSFPAPPGFSLQLFEKAGISPNLWTFKQDEVGDVGKLLWVLMGGVGIVMLIACANVANLLLVRIEGRQHELAIRAALGAGWRRIAGELLLESLVLGLLGSAVGLGLAYGALRALVAIAPEGLPRLHEIVIDVPVLLFTLGVSLFASLLFGALPVFKYAGARLGTGLREAGRAVSQSRERHRARNALVIVQVALAIVLLISSGLMIRTFRAMTHVNPGFTGGTEVQTLRLSIPEAEISDAEKVVRAEEAVMHKIESVPGVASVGICSTMPMDGYGSFDPVFAQDRTYAEGELPPLRRFKFISPGFLKTMGTPLIAGRDYTWEDVYNKLPVAIVSENMAREYWKSPENALGKRVRVSTKDDWREVVGVAADVRDDGVSEPASTSVYWPMLMSHFESDDVEVRRTLGYAIRSPRAGSESFLKEIRAADDRGCESFPRGSQYHGLFLQEIHDANLIYAGDARGRSRHGATTKNIGLYGVIAYSVSQRTREIGIRMALGAQQQDLVGMFVRQALLLTAAGIVCGLGAAFGLMRLMTSLLFNVSPVDGVTYVAVTIGLVATAALASYLPSRRAAAVDPVEALRAE